MLLVKSSADGTVQGIINFNQAESLVMALLTQGMTDLAEKFAKAVAEVKTKGGSGEIDIRKPFPLEGTNWALVVESYKQSDITELL